MRKIPCLSFSLIFVLSCLLYLDYNRSNIRAFYDYEQKEITKVLKQCGAGYYLSVIPVGGFFTKTYTYSKLFTLIDDNFINDVKQGNIAYKEKKEIDKCTYSFINATQDKKARIFDNINQLPNCKTIQSMIVSTNRKIKNLGFTVIKNYRGTIIVYILTNTNKEKKCSNEKIKKLLENLSNNIKDKMLWTL